MNSGIKVLEQIAEIEVEITKKIEEESEIYDLDDWDIAEIRKECYKACGWSFDPFAEDDEEEPDEYAPYRSMSDRLAEICMSERDFF